MKRVKRAWLRAGALLLAVTLGTAIGVSPAMAKFDVEDDFTTAEAKRGTLTGSGVSGPSGWSTDLTREDKGLSYIEYDLSPFADRGTGYFELELTRKSGRAPDDLSEALVTFYERPNDSKFYFGVVWESTLESRESLLTISGSFYPNGQNLWGGKIPLGRRVLPGETVVLGFSWSGRQTQVFVNGKEVAQEPIYYDNGVRKLAEKRSPAVGFGDLLAGVTHLRVGQMTRSNPVPSGDFPLTNAYVRRFAIRDALAAEPRVKVAVCASVSHNALKAAGFSGKLVAGDALEVTVEGTPGATGTFDLVHYPEVGGRLTLDWRGWGVYLEEKVFFEKGEVNLRDVEGYRVYAGTAPFDPAAPGMEPIAELEPGVQSYAFEFLEVDKPYYLAAVARMRDGTTRTVVAPITKQPMIETAPGIYAGTYQAGWQDRYPRAVVVGRLEHGGVASTLVNTNTLAIDSGLTIAVAAEPNELKADEVSKAKVSVTVTDANGNPVSGHKMKFVLATTSQYTGVVGGGEFAGQVGGTISENRFLETDLFGKVEVTYVAGFAAKTAVIVARDMLSNSTGSGWIKTYIQATAQLELEPVRNTAAMDAGYTITVTSSDEWLTADGKSQARITARVTLNNQPVEGHRVDFSVSSGAGSIRTVKDTTDRNGEARAVFTAGKKIGIVLITATDTTAGISGTVAIELRSDAPAKIVIKLDPEKLPADGSSRAELSVLVTDINDNPNDNTEVEYAIASGGGKLRYDKGLTDRSGENANEYTAGSTAGTVTFNITVRSTVPTEDELAIARGLAVAVTDYEFF
jgi:hypothetical protein